MLQKLDELVNKTKDLYLFNFEEAFEIYSELKISELMYVAHQIRLDKHKNNIVTYIIDRNINITNICNSYCQFCSFYRKAGDNDSYITNLDDYQLKIAELFKAGGNQVLLQGGMHPDLGVDFYTKFFVDLKTMFPNLYIHALSPPEIVFLSKKAKLSVEKVLLLLQSAGLDSLPGGGAEILSDRVRKILAPNKATSSEWLNVMKTAHELKIPTTATMMFGHIETKAERIEHILAIRNLQLTKPQDSIGFKSFIPWTFQSGNTALLKNMPNEYKTRMVDYLKIISLSRILLYSIDNIQASWLTTGTETAMISLHAGANDLGSIMLEENVVASTGVYGKLSVGEMKNLIIQSGFVPKQRNQNFDILESE